MRAMLLPHPKKPRSLRAFSAVILVVFVALCAAIPLMYIGFFVNVHSCRTKKPSASSFHLPLEYPPALRRFVKAALHPQWPSGPGGSAVGGRLDATQRHIGAWTMSVNVASHDQSGFARHFVYESKTTGSSFRVPLPELLDHGDRGAWIRREKPFQGCRSIDNHTCRYGGSDYGSVMTVHTFASLNRMPSVPCVARDFDAQDITYHPVRRANPEAAPHPDSDLLLDNGVEGLELATAPQSPRTSSFPISDNQAPVVVPTADPHPGAKCVDATLIPLFVPQGAYFAHFMNGVMPRLAVALAHREARGEEHSERIHIILLPDFKSNDAVKTIEALPNVTVSFTKRVPVGVCYRRIVSVCGTTPGFDPRTGTEINRIVRKAFFKEEEPIRLPAPDFEGVMTSFYNAEVDERHYRYALPDNVSPLHASPMCTTRVYAGRKRGNRNGRRTPNEEDVIAHLRDVYNFTVFEGGETLEQWASAMKSACVFVGAHGGAMSHLFWLNPDLNPAVIEFDGYNKYSVFWYLSATIGFNYGFMNFDKGTGLDLERLDEMLAKFGVMPTEKH